MDAAGVGDRGTDADALGMGDAPGHVGHHVAAELIVGTPQAVETEGFRALDHGDAPVQGVRGNAYLELAMRRGMGWATRDETLIRAARRVG